MNDKQLNNNKAPLYAQPFTFLMIFQQSRMLRPCLFPVLLWRDTRSATHLSVRRTSVIQPEMCPSLSNVRVTMTSGWRISTLPQSERTLIVPHTSGDILSSGRVWTIMDFRFGAWWLMTPRFRPDITWSPPPQFMLSQVGSSFLYKTIVLRFV